MLKQETHSTPVRGINNSVV